MNEEGRNGATVRERNTRALVHLCTGATAI
ncbi:MAG: hypothetical protein GFGODING_00568 [Flavobacteriales bacterium]|nr:hypothetical protein [Flavobacteriales bacterium]